MAAPATRHGHRRWRAGRTSSTYRRSATAPAAEDTCHVPNESVSVARVSQAVYGTAAIAHSLVGIPVCGWTVDEI